MKKLFVFLAAIALVAVSCNKDKQPIDDNLKEDSVKMRHIELRATIDAPSQPGTKANYYNKKVQFAVGDKIAISGTAIEGGSTVTRRYKLTATGVENETTVVFEGDVPENAEMGKFAYYPYEIISEHSVLAGGFIDEENPDFIWPGESWPIMGETPDGEYIVSGVQVPMIGYINTTGATMSATFYHLGAIAEVTLENVPADAKVLQFENNTPIQMYDSSGQPSYTTTEVFTIYQAFMNADGTPHHLMPCYVSGGASNRCSVAVDGDGTYYIPLPAGTYTDFSISLIDGYSYSTYDQHYYKQRISKPGTSVTLERGMHANFGTITYDADQIDQWFLRSDMTSWYNYNPNFQLIKTAPDTYEISTWADPDTGYNFSHFDTSNYSFAYYGVANGSSGIMTQSADADQAALCSRATNEIFTATITKSGDDWVLSDRGWNDYNRCFVKSNTQVVFYCSSNNDDFHSFLTKSDNDNNMLWCTTEPVYIAYPEDYNFAFEIDGQLSNPLQDENGNVILNGEGSPVYRYGMVLVCLLANPVVITDAKPYAQAVEYSPSEDCPPTDFNYMVFNVTPGYYHIYLDMRTLNFMFVRTTRPIPIVN